MLHFNTVKPSTLSLLKTLQGIPELHEFYLVGGTALALWYGHRISVDLDLFGKDMVKQKIIKTLAKEFGEDFQYDISDANWAVFAFVKGVKVDIIHYDRPNIEAAFIQNGLKIASVLDIAAMKVNAILNRANKKDFWDIHEILLHYNLEDIIKVHAKKYPDQMLLISIPQALTYFKDAESSETPKCLKGHTWEDIKRNISLKVSQYLA